MTALPEDTISAVVCCRDDRRFPDLLEAVASLLTQCRDGDEVVVVVDHNPGLLARAAAALPGARVIANMGPEGLSGARNAGVEATDGVYVVFLDDDAVADAGMIEAMRDVFRRDASVAGVAGWIVPLWLGGRPAWFPSEFLWVLGCSYEGLHPGPVRNVIGASMAVRRSVFETVGLFASGIGRGKGRLPLGCEETELCIRTARAMPGMTFFLAVGASCGHKVPASRATWGYLVTRCYAEGISKAALAALAIGTSGLTVEKAYVRRVLPMAVARGLRDGLLRGESAGFLRVAAVVLGFGATTAGYGVGRCRAAVASFRLPAAAGSVAPVATEES